MNFLRIILTELVSTLSLLELQEIQNFSGFNIVLPTTTTLLRSFKRQVVLFVKIELRNAKKMLRFEKWQCVWKDYIKLVVDYENTDQSTK